MISRINLNYLFQTTRWHWIAKAPLWIIAVSIFITESTPFVIYLVSEYRTFFGFQQSLPSLGSLHNGLASVHKAVPFIVQIPLLIAAFSVFGRKINGTDMSWIMILSGGINALDIFSSNHYESIINTTIVLIICFAIFSIYKKKRMGPIFGALIATSVMTMLLITHLFFVLGIDGSIRSEAKQQLREHMGGISTRQEKGSCPTSYYDCQQISSCGKYINSNDFLREAVDGICVEMMKSGPGSSTVITIKAKDNIHLIGYLRDNIRDLVIVDVHYTKNHAKTEILMSALVFLLCMFISLSGIAMMNIHRR